jgi:quercetin dioxygenase-like cupin family protein
MAGGELKPVSVGPQAGETVFLVGDTYTILLSGKQTGGAFTLLEALVPPDTGPPPHHHNAEDETFILLEGKVTFQVGDDVIDALPGTTVFVPRGVVHSFKNVHDGLAKMLFMYNPAGMDGMFTEIGHAGTRNVQAPPLDMADIEAMIAVSAKYNFTIAPPQ